MPVVAPPSKQFADVNVSENHNKYSNGNTNSQYKDLRKPRRVKFYVNGDRFFKGKKFFVTPNRYFNFHDLLNDLTNKLPKNNVHLPYGVRQIFNARLGEHIKDIEHLQDGKSYVCAGFESFKTIKYGNYEMEPWSFGRPHEPVNFEINRNNGAISQTTNTYNAFHPGRYFHSNNHYLHNLHKPQQQYQGQLQQQQQEQLQYHQEQQQQQLQLSLQQVRKPLVGISASYNRVSHVIQMNSSGQQRPKVITVVRYGTRPRNSVKMFLNRQMIQSFEQILVDISECFGAKRQNDKFNKLFSLRGKQVYGINDFFREDDVFLAVGNERISDEDIQDIIEDLYPNSPYAKSLMKQWEKMKRCRLIHDNKCKSEKLDSGFGSSESSKKAIGNDPVSSGDNKPSGYSMELVNNSSSRLNQTKDYRIVLKADQFKDQVLYEEDVKMKKSQKKIVENAKSCVVRNNKNNKNNSKNTNVVAVVGDSGGGGVGNGDDSKVVIGRGKRREGVRDEGGNNYSRHNNHKKYKMIKLKKEIQNKSVMIVNEDKENLSKPIDDDSVIIETVSKIVARISSPNVTTLHISKSTSITNTHPHITNNNTIITSANTNEVKTISTTTKTTTNFITVAAPAAAAVASAATTTTSTSSDVDSTAAVITTTTTAAATATTTTATTTTSNTTSINPTTSVSNSAPSLIPVIENIEKTDDDQVALFEPFPSNKFKLGYQVSNNDILGRYHLGRTLGYGNFAEVREAKRKKGIPCEIAMKIIDKNKMVGKEHMVENEIFILKICRHNSIVKLYEEFETPDRIYLALELVKGGDLFDAITQSVKFKEPQSAVMVQDLGSALFYLHSMGIVHRDLKPENLLVYWNKDGFLKLKLADFGLAMEITEDIYTVCGTPTYVAPEILTQEGYGLEVDMWATGVICFILLCGFPPFHSHDRRQSDLFEKIKAGEYEFLTPYWDQISNYAKGLIRHLLVVDRRRRYTAVDVLCHPWILCGGDIAWILQGQELTNNQKKLREKLLSEGKNYLNIFNRQKI